MRQQIRWPKNLRAHLSPTYNAPKWILGKKSKLCWQKKILKLRLCVRSNDVVLQSPTTTCIPIETQVTLGNCNFPDIFAFWWIISFSFKRKSCCYDDFQCFLQAWRRIAKAWICSTQNNTRIRENCKLCFLLWQNNVVEVVAQAFQSNGECKSPH